MTLDDLELRLYGVYRQDKDGHFMLRVKIPAGILTTEQADTICSLSEQFSNGILHLTCRGSIEFHWLKREQFEEIFTRLADIGLTTRGACGGAIRGISCSTIFAPGLSVVQGIAQKLNRHFAGNPAFEGLPKKFKISIDTGYQGSRYLIQDLGFVMIDGPSGQGIFDVWCAGGLGREPQTTFLLEQAVPAEQLIHLVESVVQVYRENTPPPKRLKFLLKNIGEKAFRKLLQEEMVQRPYPEQVELDSDSPRVPEGTFLEIPVFSGELKSTLLTRLSMIAEACGSSYLAVTANQNIALLATSPSEADRLKNALAQHNFKVDDPGILGRFRVCPGSHECRMGLAPTRDLARQIAAEIDPALTGKIWALSGCRNSCTQPQLADFGIVTNKLYRSENGVQQPLFDLYRREDINNLGICIGEGLSADTLCEMIRTLK